MEQNSVKKITIIFLALSAIFLARQAKAATLSISPSLGNQTIGSSFSISISASSANQSINAISGTLTFPTDKLEVINVSKTNSIINFWAQEPTISNQLGEVNFEGIVTNPGYIGSSGKILTVSFKAKNVGLAKISFSSGSILANDGLGTGVLEDMGSAEFNISTPNSQNPSNINVTTPSIASDTLKISQILSSTHPDSNFWYPRKNVSLNWGPLPEDTTAVRTLLDDSSNSLPNINYSVPIDSKTIEDVGDGIWYFHVQLKNKNGWGSISHFKINIDTGAPNSFEIYQGKITDPTDPQPTFSFKTTDKTSGIDSYKVKIDDNDFVDAPTGTFQLPKQKPGKHSLVVQAIDKAGNKTTAFTEFIIDPIESPKLTKYSEQIQEGELLYVEGITYPNSSVYISITAENKELETKIVRSSPDGTFSFVWPKILLSGEYSLYAQAINDMGAMSNNSDVKTIKVSAGVIIQIGRLRVTNLYAGLAILLLVTFLAISGAYGWYSNIRHKVSEKKFFKAKKGK